jgi:hypothetical protein
MQKRIPSGAKPGTPSKGDRKAITVRVPAGEDELFEVIEATWKRLGFRSANDYLNVVLAQVHGTTVPAYARPLRQDSLLNDDMLKAG